MDTSTSNNIEEPESSESLRSYMLGTNVFLLRRRAKLTKTRLCLMVGIGRPFLDRIERGEANPRLSIIVKLAEALGTTPQNLLTPPFEPFKRPPKQDNQKR